MQKIQLKFKFQMVYPEHLTNTLGILENDNLRVIEKQEDEDGESLKWALIEITYTTPQVLAAQVASFCCEIASQVCWQHGECGDCVWIEK